MMHFQVLSFWEKTKQSKTDAFCSSLGTFKYAVQTGSYLVPMVRSFKINETSLGGIIAWWYLEMFILHQSNFNNVSIFYRYFGLYLQIVKVRFLCYFRPSDPSKSGTCFIISEVVHVHAHVLQ